MPEGDDIPAKTAVTDVVDRGKSAREVVRLAVGGRRRDNQTDMACHRRQRRQHGDRLQSRIGVVRDVAFVGVPHRHVISDEDGVHPGGLRGFRKPAIVGKIEDLPARGIGMAPGHAMVALGVEEKRAQDHRRPFHILDLMLTRSRTRPANSIRFRWMP